MTATKIIRDFTHTVLVLRARALAADEMVQVGEGRTEPVKIFELTLLAAAAPGEIQLPQREVVTPDGAIGITFERTEGVVRVLLQLKGFAALSAFGGHAARLIAGNGSIDYAFRFDDRGAAVCSLADTPAVVEGLGVLRIVVQLDP